MANKQDYVELGKSCAHVCQALSRGLKGRQLDELSQSVLEAIGQLTAWVKLSLRIQSSPLMSPNRRTVAEIQRKIEIQCKRNTVSRAFNAGKDKDTIATWGRDLDRILNVFNVRSIISIW